MAVDVVRSQGISNQDINLIKPRHLGPHTLIKVNEKLHSYLISW